MHNNNIAKKAFKDTLIAIATQGIALICGFFTGIILPKVLGVEEYGYYQLFFFYSGYVSCISLGIHNGAYLINGGKTFESSNKRLLATLSLSEFIISCFFAVGVFCFGLIDIFSDNRAFVFYILAIYIPLANFGTFISLFLQSIAKNRSTSFAYLANRLIFMALIISLIAFGITDSKAYITAYAAANVIGTVPIFIIAFPVYKKGVFTFKRSVKCVLFAIQKGLPMLLAEVVGWFIVGVSQMFVDIKWGIYNFSYLSFALALVSTVGLFIGQVSPILFPLLRRASEKGLGAIFALFRNILTLISPFIYITYFPITYFIQAYLPDYSAGISWFALVLPICIFNLKAYIIGQTFLNVFNMQKYLLLLNIITLIFSSTASFAAVFILKNLELLCFVIVLSGAFRSALYEYVVSKRLKRITFKPFLADLFIACIFIFISQRYAAVLCIALLACIAISLILFKIKDIKMLIGLIKD